MVTRYASCKFACSHCGAWHFVLSPAPRRTARCRVCRFLHVVRESERNIASLTISKPERNVTPMATTKRRAVQNGMKSDKNNSYAKLRDGSWGVRMLGSATANEKVTVVTKDEKVKTETLGKCIWFDAREKVSLWTVIRSTVDLASTPF
jgi:hypothetical protein